MLVTVQGAATSAAVSVAASLGVSCAEPAILADGANIVVRLSPAPVVAKVAASTSAVRADVASWLQRELDVASFLSEAGAPVLAPSPEVPATVHHGDGHVMSFWTYREPSARGLPDDATMGSMLRELHDVLRTYPAVQPVLAPLDDIPAFLARPHSKLSPADAAAIGDAFARLTAELGPTDGTGQALHGDAGGGNLMATGDAWVWHDFEDTCFGPVTWDLAASTANQRRNAARVLAAYGRQVDATQLRICEELRRLNLTVWYSLYAERLPDCRQRAADLLATWRT